MCKIFYKLTTTSIADFAAIDLPAQDEYVLRRLTKSDNKDRQLTSKQPRVPRPLVNATTRRTLCADAAVSSSIRSALVVVNKSLLGPQHPWSAMSSCDPSALLMAYCHQVAAPSTFKSTPARHVAIPLPRSVNVRSFSHSRQILQDDDPLNLLSYNPPVAFLLPSLVHRIPI